MVTLMILFFILVYIILAVLFVKLIKKFTKRKLYKWLAVAFVILLPTWDVVLGIIAYPLACKFIPKTAIYETAETDGIYYEGEYKNTLWTATEHVAHADFDMMKGYKYMESLVTKKESSASTDYQSINSVVYRCTPLAKDPLRPGIYPHQCIPVSGIQSEYMVQVKKITIGISEMHFMKIKSRTTGKLMGEYNEVIRWPFFPFFNWYKWKWWGGMGTSCPARSRFYDFQYDVLKLKQ